MYLLAAAASIMASSAMAAPLPTADVLTQQGPDLWRASKLLGVTVYGPENKRDGDITDVLIDHAGHAAYVVIGVGGFLGLGQKDVALPYDQVRFTDQPMAGGTASSDRPDRAQAGAMGAGILGGAMDAGTMGRMSGSVGGSDVLPKATGTGDTGTGGGVASNTSGTGTETGAAVGSTGSRGGAGAATPDRITAYPNHGTISLTADQLKAAPSFRYAD